MDGALGASIMRFPRPDIFQVAVVGFGAAFFVGLSFIFLMRAASPARSTSRVELRDLLSRRRCCRLQPVFD